MIGHVMNTVATTGELERLATQPLGHYTDRRCFLMVAGGVLFVHLIGDDRFRALNRVSIYTGGVSERYDLAYRRFGDRLTRAIATRARQLLLVRAAESGTHPEPQMATR